MTTADRELTREIDWTGILLFYTIACASAFPFNTGRFTYSPISNIPDNLGYLPAALGPAIASLVLWRRLRGRAVVSPTGGRPLRVMLFCATPVAAFAVVGMQHKGSLNPHVFGLLYGSVNLAYAIMEEAGWRGYLQNALRPLPELARFLLAGLLWWAWHMRFASGFDLTLFPLIVIASAVGLGKIAESTHSFLISAGIHLLIILLTNTSGGWDRKLSASCICLVVWGVLLWDPGPKGETAQEDGHPGM